MSEDVNTWALFKPNVLTFGKAHASFLTERSRVANWATSSEPSVRLLEEDWRTRCVPFRCPLLRAVIIPAVRTGTIIAVGVLWATLALWCRNHDEHTRIISKSLVGRGRLDRWRNHATPFSYSPNGSSADMRARCLAYEALTL